MNKLIILSGVPGSGKSYFSQTLQKVKNSHVYVVSSDEIRRKIGGSQTNLDNEELVWKMFPALAEVYAMDKDGVVILDATHISSELRVDRNKDLRNLFDEVILLMWSLDKNVVSNQNLQREYPLPPEAMEMFFKKFELPNEKDKEFFDRIIMVKDNNIASVIEELKLDPKFKLNI